MAAGPPVYACAALERQSGRVRALLRTCARALRVTPRAGGARGTPGARPRSSVVTEQSRSAGYGTSGPWYLPTRRARAQAVHVVLHADGADGGALDEELEADMAMDFGAAELGGELGADGRHLAGGVEMSDEDGEGGGGDGAGGDGDGDGEFDTDADEDVDGGSEGIDFEASAELRLKTICTYLH
jgi:hypothetical protein